jgi:hypothetical protein
MRSGGIAVVACTVLCSGVARADQEVALDDEWPAVPAGQGLSLDQQIVDRMTELGNRAADHIDVLSRDAVGLHIDGRHQRAHLRLTAGKARYLTLRMDEDIHIGDGMARVASHVDLGIGGHSLHLELPDFEMVPASYQGDRYVEVRLPLFERRW